MPGPDQLMRQIAEPPISQPSNQQQRRDQIKHKTKLKPGHRITPLYCVTT